MQHRNLLWKLRNNYYIIWSRKLMLFSSIVMLLAIILLVTLVFIFSLRPQVLYFTTGGGEKVIQMFPLSE